MAGKGPAPKPSYMRQRRNKKATKATLKAPETGDIDRSLPGTEWHPATLLWWKHVWESPMATEYLQTDADGLVRLAILIDQFYRTCDKDLLSEIRLQEARFGLSPVDRSRLQWEVQKGEEAARRRKLPSPDRSNQPDPRSILQVVK